MMFRVINEDDEVLLTCPNPYDRLPPLVPRQRSDESYRCSKCLKFFSEHDRPKLKRHCARCKPLYSNGIVLVEKGSPRKLLWLCEGFARLYQLEFENDLPSTYEVYIRRNSQKALVYFEAGKPLGMISFTPKEINNERGWRVDDFYVLPAYRRKGIGIRLLNEMRTTIRFAAIELTAINPSNYIDAFLKKRGFVKASERKHPRSQKSKDRSKSRPGGPKRKNRMKTGAV